MTRRAVVVVLDACGVGALPDAADYGDEGANTLGHLAERVGGLDLPTLGRLGLGSILPLRGVAPADRPVVHGRLAAAGPGKDSTAGHLELMGVVAPAPLPVYPEGFPPEIVDALRAASGRGVLCNRPYNGLDAIEHFGAEHLRTGDLILYTSQDSVLQIAAHVDVVPTTELIGVARAARELMQGEHAVGRVIARPFDGPPGHFERTPDRRDLSLPPPSRSYLEELDADQIPVHTVGKVGQMFAGVAVGTEHAAATNRQGLARTTGLLAELEAGLLFCNLIDTDQVYGHRKDAEGFHAALREIDAAVAGWLGALGPDDLLVLTADHGCDVTMPGSDHTREHVPLLAVVPGAEGVRHDGPMADVGASVLHWLAGRDAPALPGRSFAS